GAVAQLDPPVTESQFTDATGRFTLDRILPGQYNLTVAAGGYKPVIVPVLVDNKPNFAVTLPDILRLGRGPVGADAPTVVFVPPAPSPATPEAPQGLPSPAAEPSGLPTPTPPPAARVVATLVGNGEAGLADGVGGAARLNAPRGLELGPAGEALYVADEGNGRLRRVTLAGAVSTVGNAIQRPFGVALDATGGLYGVEFFSGVIKQLSPTGAFERFAGGSPKGSTDGPRLEARFSTLGDAVVAADGTMYVADTGNHRIRRITPGGVVSTLAGSRAGFRQGVGAEALFDSPEGLVLGPEGVLYVADTRNHSIRRVTRDGLVSLVAGRTTTQGKGYVNGPLA
ncbi:MAG: hypothetical protein VKQ33_16465, partial [Candidatus Sericytochromatia bacterium]|nr:hypothetical protein [Candidatus Sericytochromatia bacterium]